MSGYAVANSTFITAKLRVDDNNTNLMYDASLMQSLGRDLSVVL